jgi:hypothetical protein
MSDQQGSFEFFLREGLGLKEGLIKTILSRGAGRKYHHCHQDSQKRFPGAVY